ncbi:hypothetical protein EMPS_08164 [Entomortierella parvispora]|uniref:Uncharacterized protein n=1 Tax=Entomortierella parvispora TaxID=205924 RepID=A0A9P3LYU5_9FUNG|nr:hypothetical protein EMPS_08164 [Entomortierella parvispora]
MILKEPEEMTEKLGRDEFIQRPRVWRLEKCPAKFSFLNNGIVVIMSFSNCQTSKLKARWAFCWSRSRVRARTSCPSCQ